jgi:hypothetical protein
MQHYCIRLAQIALLALILIEVWAVVEGIVFSEALHPGCSSFSSGSWTTAHTDAGTRYLQLRNRAPS